GRGAGAAHLKNQLPPPFGSCCQTQAATPIHELGVSPLVVEPNVSAASPWNCAASGERREGGGGLKPVVRQLVPCQEAGGNRYWARLYHEHAFLLARKVEPAVRSDGGCVKPLSASRRAWYTCLPVASIHVTMPALLRTHGSFTR